MRRGPDRRRESTHIIRDARDGKCSPKAIRDTLHQEFGIPPYAPEVKPSTEAIRDRLRQVFGIPPYAPEVKPSTEPKLARLRDVLKSLEDVLKSLETGSSGKNWGDAGAWLEGEIRQGLNEGERGPAEATIRRAVMLERLKALPEAVAKVNPCEPSATKRALGGLDVRRAGRACCHHHPPPRSNVAGF